MGNHASAGANPLTLEDFELVTKVGRGAFGKVWHVVKRDTGQSFAMKVLKKKDVIEQDLIDHTALEIEIMGSFGDHPFVVNLYYAFQDDFKLYFVMDFMNGGSLFHHLRWAEKPFSEPLAQRFLAETILGLEGLHSKNFVYRDLKLENILVDSEGHIRLSDFGLSAKLKKGKKIHTYSGTAVYLAPEILLDEGEGHDHSIDVWALGVMAHLMLTQQAPFWSPDHKELFDKIRYEPLELSKYEDQLSSEAISFLSGVLQRDPQKRLGCGEEGLDELKAHPFFGNLDWDAVYNKELPPLWKPKIGGEKDYSNFELPQPETSDLNPTDPTAQAGVNPNFEKSAAYRKGMKKLQTFTYTAGSEKQAIPNEKPTKKKIKVLRRNKSSGDHTENSELNIGDGTSGEPGNANSPNTGATLTLNPKKAKKRFFRSNKAQPQPQQQQTSQRSNVSCSDAFSDSGAISPGELMSSQSEDEEDEDVSDPKRRGHRRTLSPTGLIARVRKRDKLVASDEFEPEELDDHTEGAQQPRPPSQPSSPPHEHANAEEALSDEDGQSRPLSPSGRSRRKRKDEKKKPRHKGGFGQAIRALRSDKRSKKKPQSQHASDALSEPELDDVLSSPEVCCTRSDPEVVPELKLDEEALLPSTDELAVPEAREPSAEETETGGMVAPPSPLLDERRRGRRRAKARKDKATDGPVSGSPSSELAGVSQAAPAVGSADAPPGKQLEPLTAEESRDVSPGHEQKEDARHALERRTTALGKKKKRRSFFRRRDKQRDKIDSVENLDLDVFLDEEAKHSDEVEAEVDDGGEKVRGDARRSAEEGPEREREAERSMALGDDADLIPEGSTEEAHSEPLGVVVGDHEFDDATYVPSELAEMRSEPSEATSASESDTELLEMMSRSPTDGGGHGTSSPPPLSHAEEEEPCEQVADKEETPFTASSKSGKEKGSKSDTKTPHQQQQQQQQQQPAGKALTTESVESHVIKNESTSSRSSKTTKTTDARAVTASKGGKTHSSATGTSADAGAPGKKKLVVKGGSTRTTRKVLVRRTDATNKGGKHTASLTKPDASTSKSSATTSSQKAAGSSSSSSSSFSSTAATKATPVKGEVNSSPTPATMVKESEASSSSTQIDVVPALFWGTRRKSGQIGASSVVKPRTADEHTLEGDLLKRSHGKSKEEASTASTSAASTSSSSEAHWTQKQVMFESMAQSKITPRTRPAWWFKAQQARARASQSDSSETVNDRGKQETMAKLEMVRQRIEKQEEASATATVDTQGQAELEDRLRRAADIWKETERVLLTARQERELQLEREMQEREIRRQRLMEMRRREREAEEKERARRAAELQQIREKSREERLARAQKQREERLEREEREREERMLVQQARAETQKRLEQTRAKIEEQERLAAEEERKRIEAEQRRIEEEKRLEEERKRREEEEARQRELDRIRQEEEERLRKIEEEKRRKREEREKRLQELERQRWEADRARRETEALLARRRSALELKPAESGDDSSGPPSAAGSLAAEPKPLGTSLARPKLSQLKRSGSSSDTNAGATGTKQRTAGLISSSSSFGSESVSASVAQSTALTTTAASAAAGNLTGAARVAALREKEENARLARLETEKKLARIRERRERGESILDAEKDPLDVEGALDGRTTVDYQDLITNLGAHDRDSSEKFLSRAHFEKVFQMSRSKFYALPAWRQQKLKRDAKLL